jgi:hypothetical protein
MVFVTNTLAYFIAMSMKKKKNSFKVWSPDCGSNFFKLLCEKRISLFYLNVNEKRKIVL